MLSCALRGDVSKASDQRREVIHKRQNDAIHSIVTHTFPTLWLDKTFASVFDPPKPAALGPLVPEAPTGVGTAERLVALLTSSAVRKGSLAEMQFGQCFPDLLCKVGQCVRAAKPVQLTLMAFPFKVPNPAKVGPRQMPDLAELAALVRLHRLNEKVKSVYPPGLEIHVIHDGSYIADIFGVTLEEVRRYEAYFARLVRAARAETFLHLHDLQALWSRSAGAFAQKATCPDKAMLDWRPSRQEWNKQFSKTLGMINLRSLPATEVSRLLDQAASGQLPPEYRDLEQAVHAAMLRYYERDSLLHTNDPRPVCFPDAIHATTQCRSRRLAIWLVSRGNSLLPWHGVGVIQLGGKWSVAVARDVLLNPSYEPVFLEGEDTPFFYRQVA